MCWLHMSSCLSSVPEVSFFESPHFVKGYCPTVLRIPLYMEGYCIRIGGSIVHGGVLY